MRAQDIKPFLSVATPTPAEVPCLVNAPAIYFFFFFFPSIGAEDLNPSLQFKSSHPFICSARANVRAFLMQAQTLDSTVQEGKGSFCSEHPVSETSALPFQPHQTSAAASGQNPRPVASKPPPGLVGAAEPSPALRFAVRCCHLLLQMKGIFFPLQDGCIQHPQSPLAQRGGVAQLEVLPKSLLQIPGCGRTGKGPQQTGRAAPPFPAEFPQKMISLALN